MIKVAFVGNPNTGKTALINSIAGSKLKVGNWPGVTVEKKEAEIMYREEKIKLIDLPGVYSLSPYTIEERVTRDYLLDENPDVIINVVDVTNIERNLYLTMLLKEMGKPMFMVLNFHDEFEKLGYKLDEKRFSQIIGIEVVRSVAVKNIGKDKIIEKIFDVHNRKNKYDLTYDKHLQEDLDKVIKRVNDDHRLYKPLEKYSAEWTAVKILERDTHFTDKMKSKYKADIADIADDIRSRIECNFNEDIETIFVEQRYNLIKEILKTTLLKSSKTRMDITDKIDKFLLNKVAGTISFIIMMYIVFVFTFDGSTPLIEWIDGFINGYIGKYVSLAIADTPQWLQSFINDGIIAGVGGVLVFVPLMFFLYFFMAILEESGYMSRVAFLMDRIMRKLGLNGKAFLPLVLGFGCSVPAIYSTRTIEDNKSRKLTAAIAPLMSCGARLPVYAMFAAAFFEESQALIVVSLYVMGVIVALGAGLILKKLKYFSGENEVLIIELPPYRVPTLKMIWHSMWVRTKSYVKKAGTIIMLVLVVLWFLQYFPSEGNPEKSYIGIASKKIAPIFKPAGFGNNWQAVASIVPGIVAKELVVGFISQTIGVNSEDNKKEEKYDFKKDTVEQGINLLKATKNSIFEIIDFKSGVFTFGEQDENLTKGLKKIFTPLSAYSFMVFVLLVIPCVATLAAIRQEFGWLFMLFEIVFLSILPWTVSVIIYQIGALLGF